MSTAAWTAVERWLTETVVAEDASLVAARERSRRAGLPEIEVEATTGRLLHLLARAIGARRILEIGTLGGYSAIWLAGALPAEGRLITLEADAEYAAVARRNLDYAGLGARSEVRVGPALETLETLAGEAAKAFDLVFIDADKRHHDDYLTSALALTHPGSLIVADNVVRQGSVLNPERDPSAQGVRRLVEALGREPRLVGAVVQTATSKGWDGLALALVVDSE